MAVAAQFVDHRLRFVFAGDIIDADVGAGVTEGERDGAADAGTRAGDDGFLAFEQFAVFGFGQDGLRQFAVAG